MPKGKIHPPTQTMELSKGKTVACILVAAAVDVGAAGFEKARRTLVFVVVAAVGAA